MTAVYLALAAGVAATTIAKAKVFASLRARLRGWPGALVRCPYCVAHWLVFAEQAIYQVRLVHSGALVLDVFVSSFPIIGLAVLIPAVLRNLYDFQT